MKALITIFELLFSQIKPLKQKITLSLLLPFITGTLVLVFFTLTLIHPDTESYNDELGFTSDNDYVTIEKSPQTIKPHLTVTREKIKQGESLSSLLAQKGFTQKEIHRIKKELKGKFSPRNVWPGRSYAITKNSDGSLQRFSYFADQTTTIHIEKKRGTGQLVVQSEIKNYSTRVVSLDGTVNRSLSNSLKSAARPKLMDEITTLFSSRINFRNDITRVTKYKILYEEKWFMNEFIGIGKIRAVELSLPNRTITAYLYTDEKGKAGYFDDHGNAINHSTHFTSPCNFSRISSGFGYRIHPITRTRHFHGGVDMAAMSGTPVRATADGKLVFRGRKGMAGNMVTLEHPDHYYSQYLHLSNYALNTEYSRRIHQGEIIGYVGSTGRSTGPHLDFRIIHNGKPMNPPAVLGSSNAGTISPAKMNNFLACINIMKANFDNNHMLVAATPHALRTPHRSLVTI